jgi:hypothetical protein
MKFLMILDDAEACGRFNTLPGRGLLREGEYLLNHL